MKGIVITPENVISVQDFGDPLYKTVGAAVVVALRSYTPGYWNNPFA